MHCRRVSAIFGCAIAAVSSPSAAAASVAPSPVETIDVDQIALPANTTSPAQTTDTEQILPKSESSAQPLDVDQLPESLEPGKNENEGQLEKGIAPSRSLTAEVVAAWSLIRERGQTPTPDLIAREIGPDKLAEFLASSPAASSILATGLEPDAQARPEPEPKLPDGVVIVPPGAR